MRALDENQLIENFQKLSIETPVSNYQELIVGVNQRFELKSINSFFPGVTLHSGSVFEIVNHMSITTPIRLEIGKLTLIPNGPASLLSFFDQDRIYLNGAPGPRGAKGTNGSRSNRSDIIPARPGRSGGKGEDGRSYLTRGLLYLTIHEIEIIPDVPLSKAIFNIDGKGPNGGRGGNGGIGGEGGDGTPGISGRHDCDWAGCWCSRGISSGGPGANGGPGGLPGKGGNGGNGASIYFSGPIEIYNALKNVVELDGGKEGVGGIGGNGGHGGIGADSVHGGNGHCGRRHPEQPHGDSGQSRAHLRGAKGTSGNAGTFEYIDNAPSYNFIIENQISAMKSRTGLFEKYN